MIEQTKRVVQKGEVAVQFTGKNLTSVGGIGLFHKFAKRLGVEKALEQKIKLSRRVSKYAPARILLSLVYAFVLDLPRLSDTLFLRQDKVSHKLVGFGDFPHPSTLSRFLARLTVPEAKGIGKATVALLMKARDNLKKYQRITLDLDSHVKTVYGNQQRAKKGYNPKKPGRKGFNPLLCFIGETRDFLWGRFRPGNRYSGQGAKSFLRECLRLLPKRIKGIRLRGDSGFFDGDFLGELEKKGIAYAIAAKLYDYIQRRLGGLDYRDIGGGVSAAEFRYQGTWKRKRRMVVIREEVKEGKPTKKQPRLIELKGYSFQVIVTNIEGMAPEEVWRFYNGRANVENMIKEGMMGYGLDVTLSHYYGANVAHFFLVMLGYNLMNWFKELVLGQDEVKRMAKWVRRRFLLIAGKLVRRGRRWILTLPRDWPWQKEYHRAEKRLMALRL